MFDADRQYIENGRLTERADSHRVIRSGMMCTTFLEMFPPLGYHLKNYCNSLGIAR